MMMRRVWLFQTLEKVAVPGESLLITGFDNTIKRESVDASASKNELNSAAATAPAAGGAAVESHVLMDAFKVTMDVEDNTEISELQNMYCRAFFQSRLFRTERFFLKLFGVVKEPTTDSEIAQCSFEKPEKDGVDTFRLLERKNWDDQKRSECLFQWDKEMGRTWLGLKVKAPSQPELAQDKGATIPTKSEENVNTEPTNNTRTLELYFGSGLKYERDLESSLMGRTLTGFHVLYSRALLLAAASKLEHDLEAQRQHSKLQTTTI